MLTSKPSASPSADFGIHTVALKLHEIWADNTCAVEAVFLLLVRGSLAPFAFTLFSDHKPLNFALFRLFSLWSARQQYHLSYLSKFTRDLIQLPCPWNMVADALSCLSRDTHSPPLPVAAVQSLPSALPVNFSKLSFLQPSCPETTTILIYPSLHVVSVPFGESSVFSDLSTVHPVLWFQFLSPCRYLKPLHNLSHPGVHPTQRLVSRGFVWSGLSKDVSKWARGCLHRQRSKILQEAHSSVPQILVPAHWFNHIHVDLVGPLPSFRGFTHLFTIMERTSCWPDAVPMSLTSAEDCARALVSCWIFMFGVPAKIASDR